MATKTAATARDTLAQARETLRADIDAIRDRISDLSAERQATERAPIDKAEAEDRIRDQIRTAQAAEIFDRPQLFSAEGGADPYLNRVMADRPFQVWAAIAPDQLAAAMIGHLPDGGISTDARLAKLGAIDRDLRAAQVAEEQAARELEAATGGTVPRRLEADPAVLLAPDSELEGDG